MYIVHGGLELKTVLVVYANAIASRFSMKTFCKFRHWLIKWLFKISYNQQTLISSSYDRCQRLEIILNSWLEASIHWMRAIFFPLSWACTVCILCGILLLCIFSVPFSFPLALPLYVCVCAWLRSSFSSTFVFISPFFDDQHTDE